MVILLGDHNTGKTAYIRRYMTGLFNKQNNGIRNVETHMLELNTSRGEMTFRVWDTPSNIMNARDDSYLVYPESHGAILFIDVTDKVTYKNISLWYKKVFSACGSIPIAICGNKVDLPGRRVQRRMVEKAYRKDNVKYFDLSVKTQQNLNLPLRWISSRILNDNNLQLLPVPVPMPAQPDNIDNNQLQQMLAVAALAPLPDDDDDL